jgi:tetratricopeptide (TPR) repeat protein
MKYAILSIIFCLSALTNISAASLAVRADSAYSKEEYKSAIELYNQSIADEGVSSEIYYNLGNAYYRAGHLGKAIISYERALKLDPSNKDAQVNLEFVNRNIEDKPEDDSSFLTNVHKSIMSTQSANAWAWTAFICFILFLGAIAVYIFTSDIMVRKTGFFGGIVMLIITIYAIVIAGESASDATSHDTAVVIVPTTHLSSAPRSPKSKTEKVVPIHEGTKVEIVDSVATPDDPDSAKWYDVKINNSTRAWLRASDVERI